MHIDLSMGLDGNGSSIWLPGDISGLVVELYSEFVIKDGGNLVSQWTDQSGQGNHVTQSVDADKFTWIADELNGYPSLVGDGLSDYLQLTSGSLLTLVNGNDTPFTAWGVLRFTTAPTVQRNIWAWTKTDAGLPIVEMQGDNGGASKINVGRRGDDNSYVYDRSVSTDANWFYYVFNFHGTTYSLKVNGVTVANNVGLNSDAITSALPNIFTIGVRAYNSTLTNFGNIRMVAQGFYNTDISDPNVLLLENFLATKYGL